jgi:hypothetical protein
MSTFFTFILGALFVVTLLVAVWALIGLRRNNKVYEYRVALLYAVGAASKIDLERGLNYRWRYDAFNQANYHEMVHKFWRPLNSFYPNFDFIDPDARAGSESEQEES